MKDFIKLYVIDFFMSHTRMIFIATVLSFLLSTSILSIIYKPELELTHDYDNSVFMCLGKEQKHCAYFSILSLANTGSKQQNNVTISISKMPDKFNKRTNIYNLTASTPRKNDPIILAKQTSSGQLITINKLAPGTLVKFEYQVSFFKNNGDIALLKELKINIQAEGRIIEASPHKILIGRMLIMLL